LEYVGGGGSSAARRTAASFAPLSGVVALAVWATVAAAQDATWKAAPPSNDINSGTNWSTGTVPTGIATFDQSSRTSLTSAAFSTSSPSYAFVQRRSAGLHHRYRFNFLFWTALLVNNSSNALIINVTAV